MENYKYIFNNFFTNSEFLIDASLIPGTLFTPLHIILESIFIIIIIVSSVYLSKRKKLVKPVFKVLWIVLIILEVMIVLWDSFSKSKNGLDLVNGLSLYPCSIFMYVLPFYIWGKGKYKKMAVGYISTLGLIGSLINLIYPYRLTSYSIISFPAMHSIFYHGAILFVFLVLLFSKIKVYSASCFKDLLYPCVPTLILSIPANILNYSFVNSDYMYFKGYHPFAKLLAPNLSTVNFTIVLYFIYVFGPMIFYLPSYVVKRKHLYLYKFNNIKIKFKKNLVIR